MGSSATFSSTDPVAVIGDIHGRLDLLDQLLGRLGTRRILVVGDVVDRGPDSRGVIDRLIERRAVGVRGNHEEWLLAWLRGEGLDDWAIRPKMGGLATLRSYGATGTTRSELESQVWRVPSEHRNFLESLALVGDLEVVGHRYWMVHAGIPSHVSLDGVPFDQVLPHLAQHHPRELLWASNDPETMLPVDRPVVLPSGHGLPNGRRFGRCEGQPGAPRHSVALPDAQRGRGRFGWRSSCLVGIRSNATVHVANTRYLPSRVWRHVTNGPDMTKKPRTEKQFQEWATALFNEWKRAEEHKAQDPERFEQRWSFLKQYFGFLMLPGPTIASRVEHIERFVDLQRGHDDVRYRLRFFSPEFTTGADLFVAEIDHMDLFAAHEVAQTHTLEVVKADGSEWIAEEADAFIQAIVDDFDQDDVQPELEYEIDDPRTLIVSGNWDAEEE